jgi:putative ABC transport system permease protein
VNLRESIIDGLADVRSHKGRTLLQTLGVILGVGSLVAVQGLVDAGRRQSLDFYAEVGGLEKILVFNRPSKQVVQTARQLASDGLTWDDALALKREIATARLVDPIVEVNELVRYGSYLREQEITGVTADYPDVYKFYPRRGRFITPDDLASVSRVCVLGDTAARRYFGNEDPLGKTLYLGDVGFTVVGLMQRKEFMFNASDDHNALEWMNRMTFVPLTDVYARFNGDDRKRVAYINVVVDAVEHNQSTAKDVEALLLRRHAGVADFEVFNRSERLRREAEQGRVFDITFLIAGLVSLIVGGIVIMNIMLASFQERIREVGVRKAIGARGSDIAIQFLVESILVTSIGGGAGLFLGMAMAKGITSLLGAPAIITPKMAIVGVAASVTTGLFFGLYPAVKAARLNPVQALRYE